MHGLLNVKKVSCKHVWHFVLEHESASFRSGTKHQNVGAACTSVFLLLKSPWRSENAVISVGHTNVKSSG